jgi:hypothetical protein
VSTARESIARSATKELAASLRDDQPWLYGLGLSVRAEPPMRDISEALNRVLLAGLIFGSPGRRRKGEVVASWNAMLSVALRFLPKSNLPSSEGTQEVMELVAIAVSDRIRKGLRERV